MISLSTTDVITISFKEWLINELNITYANRIQDAKNSTLSNIFGNRDRILIPFMVDTSAKYLVNLFKDKKIDYDYDTGLMTRENKGKKEKIKLMRNIEKIDLPEPVKSWMKKQPDVYKSLKTANDILSNSKMNIDDLAIILTRNPIDVVRMGDFDCLPNQQGSRSCHAPKGSHFNNALDEVEKEGGAVAYVVKKSDVSTINLNAKEIFADPEREIHGILPISRIRIRKFTGDSDIAIPEMSMYGLSIPGFYYSLKSYLRNNQSIDKDVDHKKFTLAGGSYIDTPKEKLFKTFFDDESDYVEEEGGHEEVGDNDDDYLYQELTAEADHILSVNSRKLKPLEGYFRIGQNHNDALVDYWLIYRNVIKIEKKYLKLNLEIGKKYYFSEDFYTNVATTLEHAGDVYNSSIHVGINFGVGRRLSNSRNFNENSEKNYYEANENTVDFTFDILIRPDINQFDYDINGMENFFYSINNLDFPNAIYGMLYKCLENDHLIEHPASERLNNANIKEVEEKHQAVRINQHFPDTSDYDMNNNSDTKFLPHYTSYEFHLNLLPIINDVEYNKEMSIILHFPKNNLVFKNQEKDAYRFLNNSWNEIFLKTLYDIIFKSESTQKHLYYYPMVSKVKHETAFFGPFKIENTTYKPQKGWQTVIAGYKPQPLKYTYKIFIGRELKPDVATHVLEMVSHYDENHENINVEIAKKFKELFKNVAPPEIKHLL